MMRRLRQPSRALGVGYSVINDATQHGVRRFQGTTEPHYDRPAFRHRQTRSGVQAAVHAQPEQARSKAEAETPWPRPVRLVTDGFRFPLLLPNQFVVGDASPDDLGKNEFEAVEIIRVFAIIEPEHLLINVSLKVCGIDGNVSSLQATLEQAPEILQAVGMYAAI